MKLKSVDSQANGRIGNFTLLTSHLLRIIGATTQTALELSLYCLVFDIDINTLK